MDFYFTNRDFKLLRIASTGSAPIQVSDDTDDELGANSVGRSYTATLNFGAAQIHKVRTMAAMGNFVLYKDYRGRYVFMTIMEWTGFEPWGGTLSFVAENGGIDLVNETVGSYTATKALPAADYIDLFTTDSGFEVGINEIAGLTRQLKWDGESDTALQRIESVATQFDAEIDFRFDVSGTAVIKRYIDIYKRVGADKGQRLEVNTHLNKITTTGNIYDLYTSVVATGGTPEGSDSPITLAGYKWTDPEGRYVLTEGGVLMDTVANQKWSRFGAGGAVASITGGYINRVISYTASTQPELLQSALTGLKKATDPACNYDVEIVELPIGVDVGDTVHAVDELQDLNLSTRLLELKTSYAEETRKATLGDFLIEMDQIDPQLKELAESIKMIKAQTQWYPWIRYADDDQGTGISAIATDKAYMATVWGTDSTPSDNISDYAGHWQKVTGTDGTDGQPGPAGADGRTSYFHTAWADDVNGQSGFTVSGGDGKKYIGTYSDFTLADSTNPADYNWALFKGTDGADAVVLSVSSVNGNMFKNTGISTILTVSISVGGSILDTAEKMHAVFGDNAYLQWQVKNAGELEFTNVPLTDTRLSDEGFLFAVSAADVNNKSTFKCELYY